jgi:DNA-binding NtrC family response regulator
VFRVYLPRARPATAVKLRAPEAEASPNSGHLQVLVIDDEERICELIERLLEMAGHDVETASSSAGAFGCLDRGRRFDVILGDVVLGREDGLDLLLRLRELQPQAKCIVMSGYSPSPQRLSALRETGIEFLAKPFAVGALLRAVAPQGPSEPQGTDESLES